MAQLTGNPIKDSYLGLIKTSTNGAMQNSGFENITDGAGNNTMLKMSQTELQLGTNISTQYIKQFANNGGITEIKDKAFSIYDATGNQYALIDGTNALIGSAANYFQATSAGSVITGPLDLSGATVTGLPASTDTTYDLGSVQSTNDVDVTLTGSDATIDTIKMVAGTNITLTDNGSNQITIDAAGGGTDTTYDLGSAQSTNDVDVTLTGSDATIDTIKMVAGTNITLTDNGSNEITIDAAGGGGGDTVAASYVNLPPVPFDLFNSVGNDSTWRANQTTDGFSLGAVPGAATTAGNVGFTIFPMSPGETINKLRFNISSASGGTGQLIKLAIYDLTYRQGGGAGEFSSGIVPYNKVKDLGSIAADVTGVKTIDITSSPYVMPTNSDWGAIAIAWSLDTPGFTPQISGWSNFLWNGNSAVVNATTTYRNIQPYFEAIVDGTTNYDLPADLSDPTFKVLAGTSNPIWILMQTEI